MERRRIIESDWEPENRHILWLSSKDGIIRKYDSLLGKWVELYDKAVSVSETLESIMERLSLLESYHTAKSNVVFNESFNRSFG